MNFRRLLRTKKLNQKNFRKKKTNSLSHQLDPNNLTPLPLMNLLPWSISSYKIQNARQRKKRRSSCSNSWVTSNWSPRFFTAGLFMGGCTKTSTHYVTASTPRSPCSKSKTQVNASAATPTLSGQILVPLVSKLVIVVRCCSTCLAKGTSQTKEQARS